MSAIQIKEADFKTVVGPEFANSSLLDAILPAQNLLDRRG
jgi:hypothetical protein